MSVAEPSVPSVPPPPVLGVRPLIVSTLVALALLIGAAATVGYYFNEPLLRISRMFVTNFGGGGVALGFYLPDAFTIPLPNDVVTVLALAGGMHFFEVTLFATAGSIAGGCTGYWIGRALRRTKMVRRVLERGGGIAQQTLTRHGVTAVAVAALTPLPYSIFCWAAGAGKVDFRAFLVVSVPLRFVRAAGYLYLIQLGLFSSMG
jgi:membrane protein YqaA with SNARE-associated domain